MNNISRLIFIITCISATVDTQLFVYPSLSRYLLLEIGILTMTFVCIGAYIAKRYTIVISRLEIFFTVWIAYIVLHSLIIQPYEQYRTIYLCATLLLPVLLANMQKGGLLTRDNIVTALLLIACIHLIYIMGQHVGLLESGSPYFSVTGCNENPTVTALYLVGCLPMMATRLNTSRTKMAYSIFLAIAVYGIILLRCRAAYIGMCTEIVILFAIYLKSKWRKLSIHPLLLCTLGVVLLSLTIVAGVGLYNMKRNSADGRRLIWKLSSEMIVEKPIGYGYGLFEKHYNLKQAKYFANGDYTAIEAHNANFVYMPYNDYLEQGVEGGVIGMFMLLAFYAIMIGKTLHTGRKEYAAVFCSFAVMSLFNFVYTAILPWLLLMCYASFVISEEKAHTAWKRMPRYALFILLIPVCCVSLKVLKMTEAQLRLKKLCQQSTCISDKDYAKIEESIGTSEAYWTKRAINNINAGHHRDALSNIHKARTYTSSPMLFTAEHYCLKRIGKIEESTKYLDTLLFMAPQKFDFKRTNQ